MPKVVHLQDDIYWTLIARKTEKAAREKRFVSINEIVSDLLRTSDRIQPIVNEIR